MQIVAPISRVEEIPILAAAGADELYCSVVSEQWLERFRTSGISRRAFGNLPAYADLERAAGLAREQRVRLSLALNAQQYSAEQLAVMEDIAAHFDDLGGAAVIAGDALLIRQLARKNHRFRIHVSSIATCRNSEAAAFFQDLGADRIIFPRDITIREMEQIMAKVNGMEFEAFVLNDGCAYEEGVCHTIHLPARLGGPICLDQYQGSYQRLDGRPLSPEEQAALEHNDQEYQNWLWYRFGCGFSVTKEGLPYGPCALCALPRWQAAGLHAIKIAGRDAPLDRKKKSVEMVQAVREQLKQPENAVLHFARELRQQPQHCDSGRMCFYRDTPTPRRISAEEQTCDLNQDQESTPAT